MVEARQLVLDLPVHARFGRDDFLVGRSNEAAFRLIEGWPAWPDTCLRLSGPAGSGKSHLAAIWAVRSGARIVVASEVDGAAVPELAASKALVLEDLDRWPLDEPALFHLLNLAREGAVPVLLTSVAAPDPAAITTPDLLSRIRLAPSVALGPPDDELLRAVLIKLFADRQLAVDANVVDYLANRIERSLKAAAEIVIELDREALRRGRRVSRALAGAVIGSDPDLFEAEE